MKSSAFFSQTTQREHRRLQRIQVGLILALVIICASIISFSWHYYQKDQSVFIHSTESISPTKLDVILEELVYLVSDVIQDTLFIAKMHQDNLEKHPRVAQSQTTQLLENMSSIKPRYDQLRILSQNGMEQIRINQRDNMPNTVTQDALQDKRHRYYFQEAMEIPKGHVYISPIDLNIEHGKIEQPYKPMIRFATPIYDPDNNLTAVALINYQAQELINVLSRYNDRNVQLMLLNKKGYWIKAPDPALEWGFMFPDRQKINFKQTFPLAWAEISHQQKGRIENAEGIFNYETIDFERLKDSSNDKLNRAFSIAEFTPEFNHWKLVTYLPQSTLKKAVGTIQFRYTLIAGLLILLSAFSLFLLYHNALNRYKKRQALIEQAYFDQLTGAYNRTSLNNITQEALKQNKSVAFIFIDLDKFKPINDHYGHQTGDEVLKIVVKRIQHLLRDHDALFRLGGDEFAILLSGQITQNEIQHIVSRLRK